MGPDKVTAYAVEAKTDDALHVAQPVLTPSELAEIVEVFALRSDEWIERVRLCGRHRWYERVYRGPHHDIWIISWLPGQSTGFHDHGNSSGAFMVATGFLEEERPGEPALAIFAGQARAFGPDYAHDVRNISLAPAVSIHAYSPPLDEMNEYQWEGTQLIPRESALRDRAIVQPWNVEVVGPAARHNVQVIVFCSEGYTSSLAAASLQDLGLWRATDVVGGFHAWRAAGLPVLPTDERTNDVNHPQARFMKGQQNNVVSL